MNLGVGVNSCLARINVLINIAAGSVGVVVFILSVSTADADQFDTVNYSASAGMLYDSNVYRLPSWRDPQLYLGSPTTADRIQQLSIGMSIDKKYSNQEVLLSANITNNKYETFTNLDYDATTYKAAWLWSLGSKLNGALSLDRTQTLYSFEDIRTNTRNLRTVTHPHLSADWWFQANWHLLAGVATETSTSSITAVNSQSYRTRTTELGVKYMPSDKTSVTLLGRNISGGYIDVSPDYVALLDTGYSERQDEFKINWKPSGKSVLSASLLNVKRSYPVFVQRDYNVVQKGITYNWGMTGETQLNISLNRSVNPWFDASSSYYDTNTLLISTAWQLSAKTDMQISFMRSTSDYRNPVVANAIIRADANQSQQIAMGWSPWRFVKFSAAYVYSDRTSNYKEFEFTDNMTNLSVQASF
jgi:exopolysaccharide biosynthesis operon protein EpsL